MESPTNSTGIDGNQRHLFKPQNYKWIILFIATLSQTFSTFVTYEWDH